MKKALKKYNRRMFGGIVRCPQCYNTAEGCDACAKKREELKRKALERAHEIRKFEIELLWKRTAYMSGFQALAFAGLGTLLHITEMSSGIREEEISWLRIIVCVVGFGLSMAWNAINHGSKFWQENWEHHVDMLEDQFEGRLYKTVLHKEEIESFSASKVNLRLSRFFIALWFVITYYFMDSAFIDDMFGGFDRASRVGAVSSLFFVWWCLANMVGYVVRHVMGHVIYFCKWIFIKFMNICKRKKFRTLKMRRRKKANDFKPYVK